MEHSIMPYEAVKKVGDGCVLVLAPHPDDEVFGCGGAIMRHVEAHDKLYVVVVSDGGYLESGSEASYVQARQQESIRAGKLLGYVPKFWDIRDREVCYGESLICRIIETLHACDIDVVYVPSVMEMHPDHRSLGMAAAEAVRRSEREITVVFYEVGIPLHPNCLLDISDLVTKKQQAMACFESQLQQQPYDEQIAALNRFRSYTLPDSVRAAEAYFLISGEKLRENPLSIYHSEAEKIRFPGLALEAQHCDLVTVMIRSIGREKLLQEALDSVALQTYPCIEVLVVNAVGEGHPDLDKYCGRFPLRMCGTGKPLPRSQAANMGLEHAKGEYLIFLDDDDLFDPDHIANLANALAENVDAVVAYSNVVTITSGASHTPTVFDTPFNPIRLLSANYIPIHAVLFRRVCIDSGCRFDENFNLFEDWDFWLQLAAQTPFVHVNHISAQYRISGEAGRSGIQVDSQAVQKARLQVFKKWKKRWSNENLIALMQAVYEKFLLVDQLSGLNQIIANQGDGIAALQGELKGRDDGIAALQGELKRRDDGIAALQGELKRRDDGIAALQGELKGRDDGITALQGELKRRDDGITALQGELKGRDEMVSLLKDDLQARDERIQLIYNSVSWKITQPLRAIKKAPLILRNAARKIVSSGSKKKSIVLVTHDANYAGAQYLSLAIASSLKEAGFTVYHIVCGGGPLVSDFSRISPTYDISYHHNDASKMSALINKIRLEGCTSAICNTTVTGWTSRLLKLEGFKVISLVHELPYVIEKMNLQNNAKLMVEFSDIVVFPAAVVRDSFSNYVNLNHTKVMIKPQGLFRMNRYKDEKEATAHQLKKSLALEDGIKIVLGCGYADHRKGIDIFVETAINAIKDLGDIAFVWIGNIAPELNMAITERINGCSREVRRKIIFTGEKSESGEYEKFMAGSDVFFLSSREDPFPSVILDAMHAGVPVVAFDGCGGFSEELRGIIELLPSLDPVKASDVIGEIVHSQVKHDKLSQHGKKAIDEKYDFQKYVSFMIESLTKTKEEV